MSDVIEVVQNPKKRRTYTAKQRAHGFGGKRRKASRKRRRNPGLGVLAAANPRRRTRRYRAPAKRRYSRRRNPVGLGGMFGFVDVPAVLFVTGGFIGAKVLPGVIQRWFPALPVSGIAGMAVRGGVVLALGMGVKMVTGSRQRAGQVVTGGLAVLALEAWDTWLAPMIGLGDYMSEAEINAVAGVGRFVNTPRGLGMFTGTPRGLGLGAYVDTSDAEMAA